MKKIVSLSIVVSMISALSMLTGCDGKDVAQAKERAVQMETVKAEALNQFMHQGNGTIRGWGTSGTKNF